MNSKKLVFVGFELTNEINEQLTECSDRDKVYLHDSAFLETVTIDDRKYIGKRAQDSIAVDRLEDTARSVVSLMTRVSKDWTMGANKILIIAAEEAEPTPKGVSSKKDANQADGFDYSGLVD